MITALTIDDSGVMNLTAQLNMDPPVSKSGKTETLLFANPMTMFTCKGRPISVRLNVAIPPLQAEKKSTKGRPPKVDKPKEQS